MIPSISLKVVLPANKVNQSLAISKASMFSGREEILSLLKVGKDASDEWGGVEDIWSKEK